jgi:phosphomannomutase/phosphoglucomutase
MMNATIFREYDIRGLHATDLTDEVAENIGRAYATTLRRGGARRVAVGRDVRPSSPRLEAALVKGVTGAGLDAVRVGTVPTPALYFAIAELGLDGGVQVTGSHNPPEFNGFKMCRGLMALFGDEIRALRTAIELRDLDTGAGGASEHDVLPAYRDMLARKGRSTRGLRVVMDCGNGCAGTVVPEVFERMGHRVTPLFAELDGRFPNHLPDPTVPKLLEDLIARVRSEGAELGIGFDGDADRIGAVDGQGRIVFGDQLLALFARDVLESVPGAEVIFDVKCSQGLAEDIAAHGGRPSMWKTGHSLIKARLKETGAPLAGEMSGHMFFAHDFYGFDDALYAAARLLRYVARTGRTLAELVDTIPRYHSTPETRLDCADERKFQVVEAVKRHFQEQRLHVVDIDGARVEFGDGWGLVRASNTQPVLVVRFEARTAERLEQIQGVFMEALRAHGVGQPAAAH